MKSFLPQTWFDPRLEFRKSSISGNGMLAREPIKQGEIVYRGANHYSKNRDSFSIFLMAIGYFIFVVLAFSILNNRGVS